MVIVRIKVDVNNQHPENIINDNIKILSKLKLCKLIENDNDKIIEKKIEFSTCNNMTEYDNINTIHKMVNEFYSSENEKTTWGKKFKSDYDANSHNNISRTYYGNRNNNNPYNSSRTYYGNNNNNNSYHYKSNRCDNTDSYNEYVNTRSYNRKK
jgi:hypothetical protein